MATLQMLAYSHPVARVIVMILNELAEVYMPLDSISSLMQLLMHLFAKYTTNNRTNTGTASNTNDPDASYSNHVPSIFTIESNLPPVPEPHRSGVSHDYSNYEKISSYGGVYEHNGWSSHANFLPLHSHSY